MNDDEPSLLEDVRAWLQAGGHVLEMRVAQELTRRGMMVDQGYVYTDPESDKEREGDVAAYLNTGVNDDHWHMLCLIVECKNTTSPWIGYAGEKFGNGPYSAGSYMDPDCGLCEAMLVRYEGLRADAVTVYAITEKRSGRAKDHAYEAVRQASSAALGRYPDDAFDGHKDSRIVSVLGLPLVVTQSPLVLCTLEDSGGVALESVDRMTVTVPRLDVPDRDTDGMEVLVVRESAFPSLVDQLEHLIDGWREDLAEIP